MGRKLGLAQHPAHPLDTIRFQVSTPFFIKISSPTHVLCCLGAGMPRRSLPRICIALGFRDAETLLAHARREYEAGERFFEFRLDYLASPEQGIAATRKLLARHPDCTILATCRRHQNHGHFNGSIEEQIRVLESAIAGGANAVDVEIESAENCLSRLEGLRSRRFSSCRITISVGLLRSTV